MDISALLPFLMMSGFGKTSASTASNATASPFGQNSAPGGGFDLNQMMSLMNMMNGMKNAQAPQPTPRHSAAHNAAPDFGGLNGMLSPETITLLRTIAQLFTE